MPVSGAVGVLYDFAEGWQLAVNGTYSQRAPTAEELFARGPHDATFQFIIGDPTLSEEKNIGIDVSLRKTAGVVTGSISGFYNHYDGFIDFAPTGDVEDGLQVFVYTPKTAEFYGGEARADFHFLPLTLTRMRDQSSVPNCSAMTSGEWFGSMMPPAPTRIVDVRPATAQITTEVAALATDGML